MVDKQIITARLGQKTLVSIPFDTADPVITRKVALLLSEMGWDLDCVAARLQEDRAATAHLMMGGEDVSSEAEALLMQINRMRRTGFKLICLDSSVYGRQLDAFVDQGLVIVKQVNEKAAVRLTALGEAAALIACENCLDQSAA